MSDKPFMKISKDEDKKSISTAIEIKKGNMSSELRDKVLNMLEYSLNNIQASFDKLIKQEEEGKEKAAKEKPFNDAVFDYEIANYNFEIEKLEKLMEILYGMLNIPDITLEQKTRFNNTIAELAKDLKEQTKRRDYRIDANKNYIIWVGDRRDLWGK